MNSSPLSTVGLYVGVMPIPARIEDSCGKILARWEVPADGFRDVAVDGERVQEIDIPEEYQHLDDGINKIFVGWDS